MTSSNTQGGHSTPSGNEAAKQALRHLEAQDLLRRLQHEQKLREQITKRPFGVIAYLLSAVVVILFTREMVDQGVQRMVAQFIALLLCFTIWTSIEVHYLKRRFTAALELLKPANPGLPSSDDPPPPT